MLYDVLIIGGGVVGTLTARALSRYRLKVAVLEGAEDVAMGATKANSAIVHGGFDPHPGTLKAILNVKGTAMMEELCRQLQVSYSKNGSLVLAFSEAEMAHVRLLYQRGLDNGVPELSLLNADQLQALEPNISKQAVGALRCASAGIVSPYELAIAAMGNAMDNGADLFCDFQVDKIEKKEEGYLVFAGEQSVAGRYLVNCAGLGADAVARLLGDDSFTITPRRGEYLLFDQAVGSMVSHTVFQVPTAAGKGVLVTPTVHGNLLIGPTSDPQSDKEDKQTTKAGLDTVKTAAQKSVEAPLPFRSVITSFAGLRAVPDCEDFIIRPMEGDPHVIFAAGIESPGLSSAPAIAEYVVKLLQENGLPLEEEPSFDPLRPSYHDFSSLSMEEKNQWIQRDPAYGHIICRCEKITEGEIVAAIRRNPGARSLDGVKRRVRSGMGRCQGGFCAPFVTAILARELGIDKTEVTKKGKGSSLLVGKTKVH